MSTAMDDNRHSASTHRPDLSASDTTPNHTPNAPSSSPTDWNYDSADDENVPGEDQPVLGWPRLALLMAKTPDFAALPRFRDLNLKSLLYYQVELTMLRERLHKREYRDQRSSSDTNEYAEFAECLIKSKTSKQYKLIKDIRELLKEYSEFDPVFCYRETIF